MATQEEQLAALGAVESAHQVVGDKLLELRTLLEEAPPPPPVEGGKWAVGQTNLWFRQSGVSYIFPVTIVAKYGPPPQPKPDGKLTNHWLYDVKIVNENETRPVSAPKIEEPRIGQTKADIEL